MDKRSDQEARGRVLRSKFLNISESVLFVFNTDTKIIWNNVPMNYGQ